MRAVVYRRNGGPEVLEVVERPWDEPGAGEVRVRLRYSGVNPTDVKSRAGVTGAAMPFPEITPGQDGAGTVDAVGPGVGHPAPGDRVWVWKAAWGRPHGTLAEAVVVPAAHAVVLPAPAPFELGAALGIPAVTAHRCLTVAEDGPSRLAPGALAGRSVLVAGGAGAVGHAAVELAHWAGANVVATVSDERKAVLARRAGADHVVNYRGDDPAGAVRAAAPDGIDLFVEVALAANAQLDAAVARRGAAVAVYANNGGERVTLDIRQHMTANTRLQFVFVYTEPAPAKSAAVRAVGEAVAAGALRVGEDAGLPLTIFPLADASAAHGAVEAGTTGKVLVEVGPG
jgi:NADPH2:quinone reductase